MISLLSKNPNLSMVKSRCQSVNTGVFFISSLVMRRLYRALFFGDWFMVKKNSIKGTVK